MLEWDEDEADVFLVSVFPLRGLSLQWPAL